MTSHGAARGTGPSRELTKRLDALREAVREIGEAHEHRREELVERAGSKGVPRPTAEQAYDVAREVRLEAAYGMAVVAAGVSVRLLDGARPDVDSAEPNEPEWVDRPPDRDQAVRERRIRRTFRRLRSCLEDHPTPDAAIDAFTEEPDLEAYDY